MVADDGRARRGRGRRRPAGRAQLQPPIHDRRADILLYDRDNADGEGQGRRGRRQAERQLKQGDLLFRIDPKAISVRRRPEARGARRSRAERQAARLVARPGRRRHPECPDPARSRAAELRPAGRAVREEGRRPSHARYGDAKSGVDRAVAGGRASRSGARPPRLGFGDRRRQYDGRAPAGRSAQCRIRSCATTLTAPTDGYVTQMLLRPGMSVSPAHADHGVHS